MPVIISHPEETRNDIFEATSVELQDWTDRQAKQIENEIPLQNQYDFLRYGTSDDDMQF